MSVYNKEDSKEQPGFFKKIISWFHSPASKSTGVLLVGFILAFLLYCVFCAPKQYDLSVGSIAHETISATKDVVDEVTTEERRQAAAAAVEPSYRFQEGVKEEVLSSLKDVFNELRTVQQYAMTLREDQSEPLSSFSDTEIDYALKLVTSISLTRYQITTLLNTDSDQFEEMVSLVSTAVGNSLNNLIREGQLNQSIQTILQIVGYRLDVSLTQNIVPSVLRACLKPNMIIEQETTEIAREGARNNVEPVIYLQGQNIVREGERVTKSQLEMLHSLGLLKDNSYDLSSYYGAFLIVLLAMLSFVFSIRLHNRGILLNPRKISVAMIVLLIGLGFSVIIHQFFNAYLTPAVFVPLLLTVLLGYEAGYASVIPNAVLLSGLAASANSTYLYEMILLLLMSLIGGVASVRFVKGYAARIRVLLSGLLAAIINAVAVFAVSQMTSSDTFNPLDHVLWSVGGGMLSGILAISFQPVFETLFRLATPSRLQELCNPNQPLLRRMLIEAPGTYHHSIIVANLAEAAAERIGANPYLARAAAHYHDIGKLKRPMYFKENQQVDNPHDKIDPYISAAILTSHTRDGYQMAMKERMPQEMMDIILQHHGDTPVMFFYHKALQMSNGTPVDIKEFRYEGPRPQTREAAIVMLADTIEAAVRSMPDPTPKTINQFIERLIRGKLEDGQLSEAPITLRDIDEICDAFSAVLMGVFHERIEYPEVLHRVPVPAAHPVSGQVSAPVTVPAVNAVSEIQQPENEKGSAETETENEPAPSHTQSEMENDISEGTDSGDHREGQTIHENRLDN